jgi:hypothetical protein
MLVFIGNVHDLLRDRAIPISAGCRMRLPSAVRCNLTGVLRGLSVAVETFQVVARGAFKPPFQPWQPRPLG